MIQELVQWVSVDEARGKEENDQDIESHQGYPQPEVTRLESLLLEKHVHRTCRTQNNSKGKN